MPAIKISELSAISSVTASDFFPLDQSSSLTTYRASVTQLGTYLSTGSFTGSFVGRHTGSFSGSGVGPHFLGTSSAAISSSQSISSSYALSASYALSSSYSTSGSYALTSSYSTNSGLSGGVANRLAIWASTNELDDTNIRFSGNSFICDSSDLVVSQSNFRVEEPRPGSAANVTVYGFYQSKVSLTSYATSSDSWTLLNGGDGGDTSDRGVFELSTVSASNNFRTKQAYSESLDSYGTVRALRIKSNGVYFWPLMGVQSISRDGTFNVGVDSGTLNTESRFRIDVYSGSSASYPQTNHIKSAIQVYYGSGSTNTLTFGVSSSGQVIATGYSGSTFSAVSFYGSASYALTSSTATTSSYASTGSYMYSYNGVSGSTNYGFTSSLVNGSFQIIEDGSGVPKLFYRNSAGTLYSSSLNQV